MQELPCGTVTFVFTDIERSTVLLREMGVRYHDVLDAHNRLLRAAFERFGGHEIKTEGDAFFVAFSDAGDALAACVEGQLALASHPWPEGVRLRVRMGLHSGPATPREGDYIDLAVNQAARVSAAAHGGQILLSQETASMAAERLVGIGVELGDLGRYRLRGFEDPVGLFQAVHTGLDVRFPALSALPAAAHNFRPRADSMVGRKRDIDGLVQLVSAGVVTTIVGPGGAGKTRLAQQVAVGLAPGFADGAWLVELTGIDRLDAVQEAIARTLGIAPSPSSDPMDSLATGIDQRDLLVVLDDCDRLLAEVAAICESLLSDCPRLAFLATSREPIALETERVWRLGPLDLPAPSAPPEAVSASDAVELFVQRAQAARPDFLTGPVALEAVARICRMTDGLPLALELAAARIVMFSPEQLADRLEQGPRLLARRTRSGPARHGTLEALIDWSHDLLDEPEQILLRRLSVFANRFSIESAEAVCDAPPLYRDDVALLLGSLVDKSLVAAFPEQGRVGLLQTVRAYARNRLEAAPERTETHANHRAWLQSVLGRSAERGARTALVERLIEEYRSAVEWCLQEGEPVAALRLVAPAANRLTEVYYRETRSWFERLLAAVPHDEAGPRAQVMAALAFSLAHTGDELAKAEELAREAIGLAEFAGDLETELQALNALGVALSEQGSYDEAATVHRTVVERCEHADLRERLYYSLLNLSNVLLAAGAIDEGARNAGRVAAEAPDAYTRAFGLAILGEVELLRGNLEAALERLGSALTQHRNASPGFLADHLRTIATVLSAQGRHADAAHVFGAEQRMWRDLGVTRPPAESPHLREAPGRTREALGTERFENLCREGSRWERDEAVQRALALTGVLAAEAAHDGFDASASASAGS